MDYDEEDVKQLAARAFRRQLVEQYKVSKRAEYIKRLNKLHHTVGGYRFGRDIVNEHHFSIMDRRNAVPKLGFVK